MIVDEDVQGKSLNEEVRANCFAAEFLMPAALISTIMIRRPLDRDTISALLQRFGVSRDAWHFVCTIWV